MTLPFSLGKVFLRFAHWWVAIANPFANPRTISWHPSSRPGQSRLPMGGTTLALALSLGKVSSRLTAGKVQGNFAQTKGEGQARVRPLLAIIFPQWALKVLTLVDGCQLRVSMVSIRVSDRPPASEQCAKKLYPDSRKWSGPGLGLPLCLP